MADEKTFYKGPGATVTSARFVVGNKTYALSSISSVKVTSTDLTQTNGCAGGLIILGTAWLMQNLALAPTFVFGYVASIGLLAGGIVWWRSIRKKIVYKLVLTTTAGEQQAMVSEEADDILPVEAALVEAIVHRG